MRKRKKVVTEKRWACIYDNSPQGRIWVCPLDMTKAEAEAEVRWEGECVARVTITSEAPDA